MAIVALACAGFSAQDGQSVGELKRMYDDAVAQLRSAQDRKNALASENEKLQKELAELRARVAPLEARNAQLERDAADYAENTYRLRATSAAWKEYLRLHPDVRAGWNAHLDGGGGVVSGAGDDKLNIQKDWPLALGDGRWDRR